MTSSVTRRRNSASPAGPDGVDAQVAELGEHLPVDEVRRRHRRRAHDPAGRDGDAGRGEPSGVGGDDAPCRPARSPRTSPSAPTVGDGVVADAEVAERRDVGLRCRRRTWRRGSPWPSRPAGRGSGRRGGPRSVRPPGRVGSRRAPAAIQARITRYSQDSGPNRRPPSWGTRPVGLSSRRLAVGVEHVDPAAARLAGQGEVVAGRVVAEQAEVQPPSPLERAVAAPGVAPEPAQEAGHVAVELHGPRRRAVRRRDRPGPPPPTTAQERQEMGRRPNDRLHRTSPLGLIREPAGAGLTAAPARGSPPRPSPRGASPSGWPARSRRP